MTKLQILSKTSRLGKKPISFFIDSDQADEMRKLAKTNQHTIQQIVAHSINLELGQRGFDSYLETTSLKFFIRHQKVGKPHKTEGNRISRNNKILLTGWFKESDVASVINAITLIGESIQNIGEKGILLYIEKYSF